MWFLYLCRTCLFCWQPTQEKSWNHEAYLLFPVHLDGTLLDNAKTMKAKKEFYSTSDVLQIFRQVKGTIFLFCNLLIITRGPGTWSIAVAVQDFQHVITCLTSITIVVAFLGCHEFRLYINLAILVSYVICCLKHHIEEE